MWLYPTLRAGHKTYHIAPVGGYMINRVCPVGQTPIKVFFLASLRAARGTGHTGKCGAWRVCMVRDAREGIPTDLTMPRRGKDAEQKERWLRGRQLPFVKNGMEKHRATARCLLPALKINVRLTHS